MPTLPDMRLARGTAALAATVTIICGGAASASAQEFAPLDVSAPDPAVTAAEAAAVTSCSDGIEGAQVAPVLLLQGTGATAKDNWSWTYQPALTKLGIPHCTVDLPEQATGDVQRNGEFVVRAIRAVSERAGRRVSIIGHSQGGMVGRWALRFWPDTRRLVDDVIGFAPSNHGTTTAAATCGDGMCSAASWQQWDVSNFMKALNSRTETFAGISYTSIYTRLDEIVQPNLDAETGSSSLRTGEGMRTNVATQDICPNDPYEHLSIGLVDPVAYALAIDALTNDGPADPKRIPLTVCAEAFHPGIDPVTFPADSSAALASYQGYEAEEVPAEPALRCYTTASCAPPPVATACRRTITVRALRRPRARVAGKRVRVRRRANGRLAVRVAGGARVVIRGRTRSGRTVRIIRRARAC